MLENNVLSRLERFLLCFILKFIDLFLSIRKKNKTIYPITTLNVFFCFVTIKYVQEFLEI